MTKEEKCILAIEKGYTYDPETGNIYGVQGKEIKRKNIQGYIDFSIYSNGIYYHLKGHQLGWYIINKKVVEQIDHINGIKHDNRICNLRSVTNQQNAFNKKNTKGYTKAGNKYISQIMIGGKKIHLGSHNTEEEARQEYLEAKKLYHII